MKILEMGAIEKLILWERLVVDRYVLKIRLTEEVVMRHLNKDEEADGSNF